jgi:K+-sensing histidine kinase KdpD
VTTSIVVSLVSVGVGAFVALLSTYLTNRVAKKSRAAALRAERKEAIVAFLDVAQSVEQAAEQRYLNKDLPDDTTSRTHQMWFRQKCIELVCTSAMNEKTIEYADQMSDGCYKEPPPNVKIWNFLEEKRLPFLATARQELGIPDLGKKHLFSRLGLRRGG